MPGVRAGFKRDVSRCRPCWQPPQAGERQNAKNSRLSQRERSQLAEMLKANNRSTKEPLGNFDGKDRQNKVPSQKAWNYLQKPSNLGLSDETPPVIVAHRIRKLVNQ